MLRNGLSINISPYGQITIWPYVHVFLFSLTSCVYHGYVSNPSLQKPDEEAYKAVMSKVNLAPEHILFVDDKQENLDIARSLGWQTFWFLSTEPNKSAASLHKLLLTY